LDRHGVKGTFFVLGWVAGRHPQLVRDIHGAGHEIGSHGYWHRPVYDQSPEEFRSDLCQSRDVLMDIISEPVTAYRAPTFSINSRSFWALKILVEEGFSVDSSIFPIHHDRYGIPDFEPRARQVETSAGPLWEFPPSVVRFGRWNFPVAGGGYFRLYPFSWTGHGLARVNRTMQHHGMFYIHPWELDPDQPRLSASSTISQYRHYVNLSKTESKLDALLGTFRFGRVCDVIEQLSMHTTEVPA
jgi:polysaccharide deacetylase family protein (PEP-CTERM system associated)